MSVSDIKQQLLAINSSFEKSITWKYIPLFEKIKLFYSHVIKHKNKDILLNKLKGKQIFQELYTKDDVKLPEIKPFALDISGAIHETNAFIKSSYGSACLIRADSKHSIIENKLSEWKKNHKENEFFLETIIEDDVTGLNGAITYMVKCIQGYPISIDVKYNGNCKSFDPDWNEIPLFVKNKLLMSIKKPTVLNTMLNCAMEISKHFEYIRIDFYIDKHNQIYFSEFDFLSNGGYMFYNMEIEKLFGKFWR
jgi:hypothetical protein